MYNITWRAFLSVLAAAPLLGCAGLPVSGTLGGQTIETRVDSEVARYYVANYLAGRHTDPLLDTRIDRVYEQGNGNLPNREDLQKLSDDFSVDFAALYLADQIARVPANAWFQNAFQRAYQYTREAFPQGRMQVPGAADYDVLIVPTFAGSQLSITNLTGNPCITLPTGLNKTGSPLSITLVGKLYDEATILAAAKAYQDKTSFNKQHPYKFMN